MEFGYVTQIMAFAPPLSIRPSFGMVIRYHRETFVLACLENIIGAKQITMPDKNLNLQIHKQYRPYNMAILTSIDENIKIPFEDSKREFLQSLPDVYDSLFIETNADKIKCLHSCFVIGHLRTKLVPRTPLMQINVPDMEMRKLIRYFGCPIIDGNGNICAMITHFTGEQNMLQGLPSNCLTQLFNMVLEEKTAHGFCFKTVHARMGNIFGQRITQCIHQMDTCDGNIFTFKKNDFIHHIDGNPIDEHGAVYSKRLDSKVPLEVYFLYESKDYHTFDYIQNKTNKEISIAPLQLDKYTKLNMNIGEQYYFNGLIVSELSEEYLRTIGQHCELDGLAVHHYNNIYSNYEQKVVVVHELDITNNTFLEEYENIGLPVFTKETKGYIPILTHINGVVIHNLDTLKHCANAKTAKLRIQFTLDKTEAINLKYGNGVKVLKSAP